MMFHLTERTLEVAAFESLKCARWKPGGVTLGESPERTLFQAWRRAKRELGRFARRCGDVLPRSDEIGTEVPGPSGRSQRETPPSHDTRESSSVDTADCGGQSEASATITGTIEGLMGGLLREEQARPRGPEVPSIVLRAGSALVGEERALLPWVPFGSPGARPDSRPCETR